MAHKCHFESSNSFSTTLDLLLNRETHTTAESSELNLDTRSIFQGLLDSGFKSDHFAVVTTYTPGTVPNPQIFVDDVGAIDLPCIKSDALALMSIATPQRDSDGNVRSPAVWEIPATRITLRNPQWSRWVESEAGPKALRGLHVEINQSAGVFKKLRISQEGAQSIPSKVEYSPGKLGELVVIFPSPPTGMHLTFLHDGEKKEVQLNSQHTSIVATYAGVEQSTSVSNGYQLSLVYDIDCSGSRIPTLEDLGNPKKKLSNALNAWKKDESENSLQFIACLLQHKYTPSPAFDASSLTGTDEQLLSNLQSAAQEHGFSLYLAHIEVVSQTELHRHHDESVVWNEAETLAEISFASVWTEDDVGDVRITEIIDLDGIPVHVEGLELRTSDLIIGPDAILQQPDSTEYSEDYTQITSTHKRTVLLLWPETSHSLSVGVGDLVVMAHRTLHRSVSTTPTRKEQRLAPILVQSCRTAHRNSPDFRCAFDSLRAAAERWGDVNLFLSVMETCGVDRNFEMLGLRRLLSAVEIFGWTAVQDFCTRVVNALPRSRKWELTQSLSQFSTEQRIPEMQAWSQMQQMAFIRAIRATNPGQIEWLVEFCVMSGGDFLKNSLYPQLQAQSLPVQTFWAPFFRLLYLESMRIRDSDLVHDVINQGVQNRVDSLPAFPTHTVNDEECANVELTFEVFRVVLETDRAFLCEKIAQKMRSAVVSGNYELPPWVYYIGLTDLLEKYLHERGGSAQGLGGFFQDVVVFVLSPSEGDTQKQPVCPGTLTRPIVATVMKAAVRAGGLIFLRELFSSRPEILQGRDFQTLQLMARAMDVEFEPLSIPTAYLVYEAAAGPIINAAIDVFQVASAGRLQIVELIEFCFEVQASAAAFERLLTRLIPTPEGTSTHQHLAKTLIPIMFDLHHALARKRLDFQSAAFAEFAATVLRLFAEAMVPKPLFLFPFAQFQNRNIGCSQTHTSCLSCTELRNFLRDDRKVLEVRKILAARKHLEKEMKAAGLGSFGFTWETNRGGLPHVLLIRKPENVLPTKMWQRDHLLGRKLLGLLGSVETQRLILGMDYDWIFASIEGADERPALASLNANHERGGQKRGADGTSMMMVAKKPRFG